MPRHHLPKEGRRREKAGRTEPSGTKPVHVSPAERRTRIQEARNLIAYGTSREDMEAALVAKHADMDGPALQSVIAEAERQVLGFARESREMAKGRQKARLMGHIAEARLAKRWGAVVAAEDKLARIDGTYAPIRVQVEPDARMKQALERVLEAQGAETLKLLAAGKAAPLGAMRSVVDVPGEEVKDG